MGALAFRSEPVRRLRLLTSRRGARWESRRFVIEGSKLVGEAISCGPGVEEIYLDEAAASPAQRELAERGRASGASVHELLPGVLARACDAVTPQPIAAVVPMLDVPLDALAGARPDLVVVCVDLQDPGNAGAVVRSAAASGVGAVVFCAGAVDVYNPKAVRASAGALFHVPLVAGPPAAAALDELSRWGLRRVATVARGGRDYTRFDLSAPTALVLGSESQGLDEHLSAGLDDRITIPMNEPTESLNVAMAATVLCFEAARQRRSGGGGGAR